MTRLPWVMLCSLILTAFSVTAQQSASNEPAPACSTQITSCGCVITSSDTYVVVNDLSATQTSRPNCIEIAADHSILNLKGYAVVGKGDGTGIGILIRHGADHVVVQGGDEGSPSQSGQPRSGFHYDPAGPPLSVVTLWNIGIEDDADDGVIELFKQLGGNFFQQVGNATAGLLLSGGNRTVASDFDASFNGTAGVIARNSSGSNLSNFNTVTNHQNGLWLDSSNDSTIATASIAGNGTYGIWLMRSSGNAVLNCNGTSGNADTGILIGCGNAHCTGNERSDNNRITNSGAPGNVKNGIVIDNKNHNNIITVTHNDGNPQGHDMVDLNNKCDSNIWYNNTGTTNQDCIH